MNYLITRDRPSHHNDLLLTSVIAIGNLAIFVVKVAMTYTSKQCTLAKLYLFVNLAITLMTWLACILNQS